MPLGAVWLLLAASMALAIVSASRIDAIKKRYGPFAANRFKAYNRLVTTLKAKPRERWLQEVNDFWNGVPYGTDRQVWGKRDYWATPYEFLLKDRGDCEDYVIAKYFTLKALGVDTRKLYFVYVKVRGYRVPHMVLAYFPKPGADPLILDNLNLRIFPASKRKDIVPVYTFNGELLRRFGGDGGRELRKKGLKVRRKWEDLTQRIKRFPL